MSTPIRIKRSSQPGKRPTTEQLQLGELAFNFNDGHLYSKRDTAGVGIGTTTALLTPWKENFGGDSIYYENAVGIGSTQPTTVLDVIGDVYIESKLTVGGGITFTGISTFNSDLDIDASVDILNDLVVNRNLNITGLSTFGSDVDINASVDISNDLVVNGNLNVVGLSTFTSDLDINASIDVDGHTELDDLNVSGVSTFASNLDINASIDVDGHTELDDLNVSGVSTFASAVDINADLDVDGRAELDITNISETLNVVGVSTFGSDVDINANVDVSGYLDVDGHTELDDLNVSGVATFAQNVEITGNLTVNGTQTILNTTQLEVEDINIGIASADPKLSNAALDGAGITIYGAAGDKTLTWSNANSRMEFNTDLSATNISSTDLTLSGDLDVDGHTELDNLNVSGVSTFAGAADFNGDVDIDGRTELDITNISETLNVVGVSTFGSDVDINASIDVDGHTELDDLNVSGVSTFASAVDINSDLDVDGRTELDITNISETLNVVGISTFESDVDINASIDVDGHTELDDLNVSGVSTFASNVDINSDLDVDGRTELDVTNISETLNVVGISTFGSDIDINASIDVDGHTELDDLNVSGVSTFAGSADFNGDVDVDGHTELDTLNVSVATTTASLTLANAGVAVTAILDEDGLTSDRADALATQQSIKAYVDAQVTAQDLDFAGDTGTGAVDLDSQTFSVFGTPNEIETAAAGQSVTIGLPDNVTITNQLNVGGGLAVTGITTLSSDVDINASVDIDGHTELDDLNVSGVSTFAGAIDANGNLDVDGFTELDATNISETLNVVGVSTFESDVDINASIDVDGHTELDDLNVSGVSTFAGAIDANGDLDVDGRTELDITNISETLSVVGISTFGSDVDINASIDVDGHTELDDLNVSGVSTFASDLDINASIDVDGHTELDDLNVSGVSTFASAVDINASIDVDGHTELDDLNVSGVATFAQNVEITGNLTVNGTQTILNTSQLEVEDINIGIASADPKLSNAALDGAGITIYGAAGDKTLTWSNANSRMEFNTDLFAPNIESTNLTLNGGLGVTGVSTFTGTIDANGNVDVAGTLDVDGHTELDDVNVSGAITATTFTGDLTGNAGTATALETARNFEITGDIVASAIIFDGTGNVSLAATIQPNSVALGDDTTGSYVSTISGTTNEIEVSGSGSETAAVTIGLPDSVTITDLSIGGGLGVTGVSTFTGNIDANGDLDVDGHTELDTLNVSIATTTASLTLANVGVAVTAILDEDGLTSDRADALATQQSIKAYVDAQVTAQDLDFAGDTGTGAVDLDTQSLTISGTANEIETSASGQILTVGLPGEVAITTSLTVGSATTITGSGIIAGIVTGTLDNTLTLNTSGTGLSGSTTYNNSGASTFTVASNATDANTGGTIVARDGSGNFSAGTITADLIGDVTGVASTATKLETARDFSITGSFVTASAVSFDGTGNVALGATITPDSITLGTYTSGDYVQSIIGTASEVEVTSGSGEGSTPQIGLPDDVIIGQDLTVTRDVQINRDLNVTGNITIGGTSGTLFTETLKITDADLVLGFRTDAFGNDVSNDTTANHGGIAIASTEGNPLVSLNIVGIETLPPTYKKIMWFKAGSFSGLGTDAWLSNYAVGIGSTQFPTGTRLAVGGVQFTENDLAVVRNINASGIVTVATLDATNATIDNLTFTSGTAITSVDTDLTTVSASDDTLASAKAIKTYVDQQVTAQDLDFIADSGGALSIDLDSETLQVAGTTNEIITVGAGNSITVGLNTDVTIARDLTVSNNLNVTGVSTLTSDVIASSTLTVGAPGGITGGTPIDQGVLGVYGTGKNMLVIQTTSNSDDRGIAFRNSGDAYIGYVAITNSGSNLGDMVFGVSDATETDVGNVDERLRITKDGDVGIGTDSPTAKLDVRGDVNVSGGVEASGISTFSDDVSIADKIVHTGDTDTAIRFPAADTFTVETAGSERVRVTSTGNVGIGTDNPSEILNVYSTGQTKVRIEGDGSETTAASLILQDNDAGSNFRGHGVFYYDSISDTEWFSGRPYNGSDAFSIHRKTSVTTPGDTTANKSNLLFIIDSAGDVGIATNNPSQKLDVNGDIRLRGAIYDSLNNVGSVNQILVSNAGAGVTWTDVSGIPVGDANTLDGLDSTQFLRSDVADTKSGITTFSDEVILQSNLNVTGVSTFQGNVNLGDNDRLRIGDDGDLELYYDGTNSYIKENASSGSLIVNGNWIVFKTADDTETYARFITNAQAELYYNNSKKFETTGYGVTVNGGAYISGVTTASSFVKEGGTSSQFLKADGSVDSNTYLTAETDTLDDVTSRGNTTSNDISVGVVTATALHTGAEGSAIRITSDTISGPAALIIDPAAVGDDTGLVRIKGDLYVDGEQFIVSSSTIELADLKVGIATTVGTNVLLDGGGIGIGSASVEKTILWNNSSTSLKSSENWDLASGKVFKINGTEVLSSTTLGSGVVNSSLTTVGTLLNLNVSGVVTATAFEGDGSALTNLPAASIGINTNTTNLAQLIPFAVSYGSTTGLGATDGLVYNPSSGRMGIGSDAPAYTLDVAGDINSSTDVKINGTGVLDTALALAIALG